MAISGVSMPSTMIDYSRDNTLNSAAGTGDPFATPTGPGSSANSSSSSMSAPDAQAMASSMLGSLPNLSTAWAGMAGA